MSRENVLRLILEYIEDRLVQSRVPHTKAAFDWITTVNWAMREVYNFVYDHPELEAIYAIEYFARECNRCSLKDPTPYRMFTTAYDVAYDIYDYVLSRVPTRKGSDLYA